MNNRHLQDRISWGMNIAARMTGQPTDAYRPVNAFNPLAAPNRFLRLHASFTGADGRPSRPVEYGSASWRGVFDSAYTRPGDYLVCADGTWFIAAQQPLLPVLCIGTNRIISCSRPAGQSAAGINAYGGVTAETLAPLLTGWPASVLNTATGGRPQADLPGDATAPCWTVLLPAIPGVILSVMDVMSDDLGRHAIITAAELSGLGWRLTAKQAIT